MGTRLLVIGGIAALLPGCAALPFPGDMLTSRKAELAALRAENAELLAVSRRVALEALDTEVRVLGYLQTLRRLRPDEKEMLVRAHNLARFVRGEIGLAPGESLLIEEPLPVPASGLSEVVEEDGVVTEDEVIEEADL